MKTKLTLKFAAVVLLFATFSLPLSTAFAQGTAFTYQGRLFSGANPANGTYNLTFSLYNLSSGGALQAGPVTTNGVVISNGLFTVWVDFGPGVFNGSGGAPYVTNWLQIGVESNGIVGFTTLTPRQGVTPAPYAIFAEGANAAGLTGTIPPTVSLPANVALLNGLQTFTGSNTFAGNAGSFIINNGFSPINTSLFTGLGLQYYIPSGEGAIMSSYNDGDGFLSFYTKAGGGFPIAKQMIIDYYGGVAIDQQNANNGAINHSASSGVGLTFGVGSGEGIASQRTPGTNQYGLDFYTAFTKRMSILQGGSVGINTTNPLAQLHVLLGSGSGGSDSYDGGPTIFADTSTGDAIYANTTDGLGYGVLGTAPSIGVFGTTTGGTGVQGQSSTGNGVFGSSGSGNGVQGNSTSSTGVYGTSGSGIGVEGFSTSSNGVYGAYQGTNGTAAGVEGVTASTSSSANAVYGVVSSTSPGGFSAAIRGQNNGTGGLGIGVYGSHAGSGWGVYGFAPSGLGVFGDSSSGTGVEAESSSGTGLYAFSSTGDAVDALSVSGSALTILSGAIHVSGAGVGTSTAAFIQLSTSANTAFYFNATRINNPLCNGDPNALLLVTHNPSGQTSYSNYNHTVGVWYDGTYWEIYSEDVSAMPTNVAFNVLIIKN